MGSPRCSICHTVLPWIVETDAGGFDRGARDRLALRRAGHPAARCINDGQEADRVVGAVPAGQLRVVLERHVPESAPTLD